MKITLFDINMNPDTAPGTLNKQYIKEKPRRLSNHSKMKSFMLFLALAIYTVTSEALRCYVCRNCATVQPSHLRSCDASATCCRTEKTTFKVDGITTVNRGCSTHCGSTFATNSMRSHSSWGCWNNSCNNAILDGSNAGLKCYQCQDCGLGPPRNEDLVQCPSNAICCMVSSGVRGGNRTIRRGCSASCAGYKYTLFGNINMKQSCSSHGCNSFIPTP